MKKKFFIGIDISKYTIDAAVVADNKSDRPQWKVFDNTAKGMFDFAGWLKELSVPFTANSIVVIENTGIYHRRIVSFCTDNNLPICVENGAQVKWSLGIARGKSDKVDSRRLAVYAMRFADRLKPAVAQDCELQYLKDLITLRSRHEVQQLFAPHSVAANMCDATTAAITTAAGPPKKTPRKAGCCGVLCSYFLKSFFGFWCNAPVNAF